MSEPRPYLAPKVGFRPARASQLLGLDIEPEFCRKSLQSVGCQVELKSRENWEVTPATFRQDISREADLVERHAPTEVHHAHHLRTADEAQAYQAEVRQRAFPTATPVECHVHTTEISDVPRSIAEHTAELTIDLIVMCTHGRGNAHRWLFGSIAQKVIALSKTPLLLIPPQPDRAAIVFQCDRILVPLDGNPDHEPGLRAAAELAQACQSAVHLLLVIPKFDQLTGEKAAT